MCEVLPSVRDTKSYQQQRAWIDSHSAGGQGAQLPPLPPLAEMNCVGKRERFKVVVVVVVASQI